MAYMANYSRNSMEGLHFFPLKYVNLQVGQDVQEPPRKVLLDNLPALKSQETYLFGGHFQMNAKNHSFVKDHWKGRFSFLFLPAIL